MFDWNGNGKKDLFDSYIDYKIFESVFAEESNSYDSTTYNATDDYDYDYDSDSYDSINNFDNSTLDLDDDYIKSLENEDDALEVEKQSSEPNNDSDVSNKSFDLILGRILSVIYIVAMYMIPGSITAILQGAGLFCYNILIISVIVFFILHKLKD